MTDKGKEEESYSENGEYDPESLPQSQEDDNDEEEEEDEDDDEGDPGQVEGGIESLFDGNGEGESDLVVDDDDSGGQGPIMMDMGDDDDDDGDEPTPPPPQEKPKPKKKSALNGLSTSDADALWKAMSEKERNKFLARSLAAKQESEPLPTEAPKKKAPSQKQQQQKQKKTPTQMVPRFFPHEVDRGRFSQYVKVMSFVYSKTHSFEGHPANELQPPNYRSKYLPESGEFVSRFILFRTQFSAALLDFFKDSPYMLAIAKVLPLSKLFVFSKEKNVHADDTKTVYCAWSGKVIENPTDVRTAALIPCDPCPFSGIMSATEGSPVSFHIDVKYSSILRAMHTVLFFPDYVNADIAQRLAKPVDPPLSNEDIFYRDGMKDKKNVVYSLCEASLAQFDSALENMRAMLGREDCFVVVTKK